MRRSLLIILTIIVTSIVTSAREKSPLRLPLGLTPGISPDSTSAILTSAGASPISGRENNYRIEFMFDGTEIKMIIPIYLKSKLLSVSMYSDFTEDRDNHLKRLKETFQDISKYYFCTVIESELDSKSLWDNLDDGQEIASFTSDNFSLFINSEYKEGQGYLLSIQIYALPLTIPAKSKK